MEDVIRYAPKDSPMCAKSAGAGTEGRITRAEEAKEGKNPSK